jgi:hypothetical protein
MAEVRCIVFALALPGGTPDSLIPAVQNLMLAARALGIGSVPTTLDATVMDRFRAMFCPRNASRPCRTQPEHDTRSRRTTRQRVLYRRIGGSSAPNRS